MTDQHDENQQDAQPSDTPRKARKPYTKPVVHSEPMFETKGLACGKQNLGGGVPGDCPSMFLPADTS